MSLLLFGGYPMEILFALAVVKSTSVEITNKFCEVLSRHERFFIKFPVNRRDTAEAIVKFREFENCIVSQVVVVIDATHVQFYLLILKVNQTNLVGNKSILLTLKQQLGTILSFFQLPLIIQIVCMTQKFKEFFSKS